jgi:sortase A
VALRTSSKLPTGAGNGPSAPGGRRGSEREPFGIRKAIRGVGKALICVGILLFLFVGYQLWGTGIAERRSQHRLTASFEKRLTTVATLPGAETITSDTTVPPLDLGDAMALIEIPKIGVKKAVVEGVGVEDLKEGPGHYPETPLPGQRGNSAIAGHRTTYGAPFYDVNELQAGDPIFVTTAAGRFRYDVTEQLIVDPSDVYVLDPTPDDRLTLTTCNPRFSAAERLIVVAKLVTAPSPTPTTVPPAAPPAETTATTTPTRSLASGLSGDSASRTPAIFWGTVAAAIWLGGWILGRVWRRWPAYALTAVPFLIVLFVFYENVARLLPANV